MTHVPYMPDEARARRPNHALQPLPLYLLPDFAQSIDRERPRELVLPLFKGEPVDPSKMGSLKYRYLDTGETATVPNIWYNQTVEMRLSWWEFEARRTREQANAARVELNAAMACTAPVIRGEKTEKVRQRLTWHVEELERNANSVKEVLDDVKSGKRFL